jgi:hypothetical protein
MRKLLLCCFGSMFAFVSQASETLCQPEEKVIFNCRIKTSPKVISICSSSKLTADEGYLQYRFGKPDHVEFTFPASKVDTQKQFTWEWHHPYQSFLVDLWFENGGYVYDVFKTEISEELNLEKGGKHEYGVRIFKKGDEKFKKFFECQHPPTGHFDLQGIVTDIEP